MAEENYLWSMIVKSIEYPDPNSPNYTFIKQNRGLTHPIVFHGPKNGNGPATILVGNKPDIHPDGLIEEFYFTGIFSNGEFVGDLCIICTLNTDSYGFFYQRDKIIGKIVHGKFIRDQ